MNTHDTQTIQSKGRQGKICRQEKSNSREPKEGKSRTKKEAITQESLKSLLLYDPLLGRFTRLTQRRQHKSGTIAGSVDFYGYIVISINGRVYKAHRLAWLYVHGKWPEEVDHINGIRSDNRLLNLRSGSHSRNMTNQSRPHCNNLSGFLGVYHKRGLWVAVIHLNKKRINLGYFKTPELASRAYQNAKRELHK